MFGLTCLSAEQKPHSHVRELHNRASGMHGFPLLLITRIGGKVQPRWCTLEDICSHFLNFLTNMSPIFLQGEQCQTQASNQVYTALVFLAGNHPLLPLSLLLDPCSSPPPPQTPPSFNCRLAWLCKGRAEQGSHVMLCVVFCPSITHPTRTRLPQIKL